MFISVTYLASSAPIFVNKQPDSDPINSPPAFFTDADAWRVGRVVHVERLFVVF